MKTDHHRILVSLLALFTAGTLVSCQSTRSPTALSALESGHWTQVQKDPPIWYPKGVPIDHPTTFNDGYWVSSGDSRGTRFFIPLHGTELPQQELIAEAQAAMTPEARKQLNRKRGASGASDVAGALLGGTAAGVISIADAMSRMPPPRPQRRKK